MLTILLAFGHLVVDMHSGALPILLPIIQDTYSLSYAQVGSLMLLSQVTSSVIQPAFGFLSDRVSTRWLLPTSLLVASGGLIVVGFSQSYGLVIAGIALFGLGVAAYHPEASKVVYHVGGEAKGRAMSLFALGGNAGLAVGPSLMAVGLAVAGTRGTVLFVPVSIVTAAIFWRLLRRLYAGWDTDEETPSDSVESAEATTEAPAPRQPTVPYSQRKRALAVLLAVIFLRSGTHTSLITFIPLFFTSYLGKAPSYSSFLLTTFLLAGAVGTAIGGIVADRRGQRPVVVGSLFISAPLVALIPFTSAGIWPPILIAAAGFILVSSWAVTTVMGQEMLPGNVGLASGLTLGFSVGTGGLTVTALGWVGDMWGLQTAFVTVAAITALGALLSMALPRVARPRPLK